MILNSEDDQKVIDEVLTNNCYGLDLMWPITSVLDVGGHIGSFVQASNILWPEAKIITVEPEPSNYEVLCKNVKDIADPYNVAIGYHENGTLAVAKWTGCHHLVSNKDVKKFVESAKRINYGHKSVLDVQLCTLSHFGQHFDLIKLDCEGSEFEILNNIDVTWNYIVGEYHCFNGLKGYREMIKPFLDKNPDIIHEVRDQCHYTGVFQFRKE